MTAETDEGATGNEVASSEFDVRIITSNSEFTFYFWMFLTKYIMCTYLFQSIGTTSKQSKSREEDFEIPCSEQLYNEIFKVKTTFTNRTRKLLLPGWTSELSALLWKERKLVCVWSWKRANIRSFDIICSGVCSGCKATIQCEATPKSLRFSIDNVNPDFVHAPNKKRRILSVEVPQLQAKLDGKSVQRVRAEMANELMSFDDPDPPILPNARTLWKTKSRIDCPETDPFTAMSFLQKKYPKTIHSIGYDPFFVIYSMPFQQALYKGEAMRAGRITISIDSTGLGNSRNFFLSALRR